MLIPPLFFGVYGKIFTPGLKVVWHDHFGFSEQLHKRPWIVFDCWRISESAFV
jgi:hypothetical protein